MSMRWCSLLVAIIYRKRPESSASKQVNGVCEVSMASAIFKVVSKFQPTHLMAAYARSFRHWIYCSNVVCLLVRFFCASLCCCAVARRRCGYISRIEAPSLPDAMPADVIVAMEWLKREQEEFLRSRHKRKTLIKTLLV